MTYRTRQRDAILRFFMDHEDRCFSVRDVYEAVDAGETTVFRAITALTDAGRLKKYTAGPGECAYYQYRSGKEGPDHIHLKCERCGALIHMDCSFMETIFEHFRSEHGFQIDCGKTVIYGFCPDCREAEENDEKAR